MDDRDFNNNIDSLMDEDQDPDAMAMNLANQMDELSSDINYTLGSSSVSRGGQPGRTKNCFTRILDRFITSKSRKPPKKEFFNAFIIRAIKRAFRCVMTNKVPKTTCIKVDQKIPNQARHWSEIGNIYRENPQFIEMLSKTETGPETDGKPRRAQNGNSGLSEMGIAASCKSFNNLFCRDFFSNLLTQRAFKAIIEIMFSNIECKELCLRFGFSCCRDAEHGLDCAEKWQTLRHYFSTRYFSDLEVSQNTESQLESALENALESSSLYLDD